MRKKFRCLLALPVLVSLVGCGLTTPSLTEQGIVKVEAAKSRPVWISTTHVYRENNETVVRGEAKHPMSSHFGTFGGHIDVEFILPDGKTITKQDIRLVRKRIPKRRGRRAVFVSRFDFNPPRGTIARIAYHNGAHENSS